MFWLILLFVICVDYASGQLPVAWTKEYGNTLLDIAPDGDGFVVLSRSNNSGVRVEKINSAGEVNSTFDYPDFNPERICTAENGGYCMAGVEHYPVHIVRTRFTRIGADGEILWTRNMNTASAVFDIVETQQEHFVAAVSYYGLSAIKCTAPEDSASSWLRTYYEYWMDMTGFAPALAAIGYGQFVFCKTTYPDDYLETIWCRANGTIIRTRQSAHTRHRIYKALDICSEPDGDIYVLGTFHEIVSPYGTYFCVESFDRLGNENWFRSYSLSQASVDPWLYRYLIIPLGDGALIAKNIYPINFGINLVRLDVDGDVVWQQTLDSSFPSKLIDVEVNADNKVAILDKFRIFPDEHQINCVQGFCTAAADAAEIVEISSSPELGGYRLIHQNGSISQLVFTDIPAGATGWYQNESNPNQWTALANGDGNDGDSIIFTAGIPLTEGTADTFWITHPAHPCSLTWSAGCRTSAIAVNNGLVEGLDFRGELCGSMESVDITITVNGEQNIDSYEIYCVVASSYDRSGVNLLSSITAYNDDQPHEYVLAGLTWSEYLLATVSSGCRYFYTDRILTFEIYVPVDDFENAIPREFTFYTYPNPFNPTATLSFDLTHPGMVTLNVFDVTGRQVATLLDGAVTAGSHEVVFDGVGLPSGIYFARLRAGDYMQTKKMVLLK
ncbi:T9SS type A sorting domain-containing protein [bacterium]|nr:T9SS type A sorting domain-containing protein [bacterium]